MLSASFISFFSLSSSFGITGISIAVWKYGFFSSFSFSMLNTWNLNASRPDDSICSISSLFRVVFEVYAWMWKSLPNSCFRNLTYRQNFLISFNGSPPVMPTPFDPHLFISSIMSESFFTSFSFIHIISFSFLCSDRGQ